MEDLVKFLLPYPEHVQETMLTGRDVLKRKLRPCCELDYDATSAVCVGFSFTGDVKGLFVNLSAYPKHVTLVFANGVELADPEMRLKGESKQVRHIRLKQVEDLNDPYIHDLIIEAQDRAIRPKIELSPQTIVKSYKGPKRRP